MNSPAKPTNVRYSILALLCFLAMITYLDRAMNANAKNDMMAAIGRDPEDFYYVLMCFQIAYAIFEIPTGWMGDTFGPRKTLLRIVLWWSAFVALTGFTGMMFPGTETMLITFGVLMAIQFMFGVGEAGAFPNIARALYNWFPANKRGFAQGAIWLSARLMGGLTPFVWVLLVTVIGLTWRQAVWFFAGVAFLWCIVFYMWFRNTPAEHPATNQAERDLIADGKKPPAGHAGVPWKKIFTSRNAWALCAMYMVTNFNWYFLMYNLPGVLKSQFKEWDETNGGKLMLAILAGAPLLIGMAGCLLGGLLTDAYIRRTGNRKWGRRVIAMVGYGMAGLCYLAATGVRENLWAYAACLMLVGFFNDFIMGPSWAAAQDIGRRYSAIVSGMMNMIGNLGATLGLYVTGRVIKHYTTDKVTDPQAYVILFTLYAAIYFAGVLAWLVIDASKPIVADEEQPNAPEASDDEERH